MLDDLKEIFSRVLEKNNSYLLECNLEPDHVHLLVDLHPDNNISNKDALRFIYWSAIHP